MSDWSIVCMPSAADVWSAADIGAESQYLGLKGSPTQVSKIYPPAQKGKAEMFSGTGQTAMEKILEIMRKEHFIGE